MAEVVAENLATNPSFETASGEVVVRENLATNSSFDSLTNITGRNGTVSITSDWATRPGGTSVKHVPSGGSDDSAVTFADGAGGMQFGMEGGKTYTFLATFHQDTTQTTTNPEARSIMLFHRVTGGYLRQKIDQAPNEVGSFEQRGTFTLPAGTVDAFIRLYNGSSNASDVVYWDDLLVTEGTYDGEWFNENSPASGDFTYRARTGGGAEKVAKALAGFPNAIQSQEWAVSGAHSLRVLSDEFTTTFTVPGTSADTYTVAVTPRHDDQAVSVGGSSISFTVAGEQVRKTVAGGSEVSLTARLNPEHVTYVGDGWWDDLLIVEGDYTGPYFDGSTPNTATHKYVWTGQPNASTSQALLVTASDFNLPPGENIRSTLSRYIWFGNQRVQQWLPMPSSGTQASYEYAVGGGGLANGGFHARRSSGFHKTYQFDFAVREADQWNGIEGYNRFASGIDSGIISSGGGTGSGISEGVLFRFCDPMVMGRNMFTPQWAAPQLCNEFDGEGFHDIAPIRGDTYVTPQNTRHYPATAPYWDLTASDSASVSRQPEDGPRHTFKLLVPPTHVLYLGFVGVVTGAGAIFVEKRFRDGTSGVETITELIDPTSGDGLGSLMVDGSEVAYVTMWLGSTSPGSAAQVALVASTAIELPYWETPDMSTGGWWTEGLGHSGLEFGDGAFVETYEVAVQGGRGRYLKGMSTSLVEVGAWR